MTGAARRSSSSTTPPQNVKLLADLLTVKGYAVATAASGAEALEQVETERPDLVLPRRHDAGDERLRGVPADPRTNPRQASCRWSW